jgi:hypothetical protein
MTATSALTETAGRLAEGVDELLASFPQVRPRIVVAVLNAYLPVTHTMSEAVSATRDRLADATLSGL